jgi:hypothetical protein
MKITVPLTTPIATHKGSINKIELSEPLARSFLNHDEPFKVSYKDGAFDFEFKGCQKAMMGFLTDMSGLDQITLEGLTASDYAGLRVRAVDLIMGLVGSENPTNSPDA